MTYMFRSMSEADAGRIMQWRYPAPYDFYNFDADEEMLMELLNGEYYSVHELDSGTLIGFFCAGSSARVPGGYAAGIYESEDVIDIGLGLEPSQTGQGMGRSFVKAGLDYYRQQIGFVKFRLVVASFNRRALQVYRDCGFEEDCRVISQVHGQEVEFICMITADEQ